MIKKLLLLRPFAPLPRRNFGFTIIELLVATLVFTIVLLIVTTGIMQIARVYFKGVTESNTQNTARTVIDTITQAIQFSGGNVTLTAGSPVAGNSYAFCVGNRQFSYALGWQVEETPDAAKHQMYHALVSDDLSGCSSSSAAQNLSNSAVTASSRDMLGPHIRLSNLLVSSVGANQYRVQIRVVYGDDDLLNNPTTATANCKDIRSGTQFCSVSELSTIVVKRVK